MQTIKKKVAKKLNENEFQTDWDVALPQAVSQYNHAIQVETKFLRRRGCEFYFFFFYTTAMYR